MRPKTDWNKLKQEYLAGEIEGVAEFLRQQLGTETARTGTVTRMTRGWRDERDRLKLAALEAAKTKHIEQTKLPNEKLLKMKENVLIIVGNKLAKEKDTLSGADLRTLWQMIKTELGEASTIQANKTELTGKDGKDLPSYQVVIVDENAESKDK